MLASCCRIKMENGIALDPLICMMELIVLLVTSRETMKNSPMDASMLD
jgi:hypothetical protein